MGKETPRGKTTTATTNEFDVHLIHSSLPFVIPFVVTLSLYWPGLQSQRGCQGFRPCYIQSSTVHILISGCFLTATMTWGNLFQLLCSVLCFSLSLPSQQRSLSEPALLLAFVRLSRRLSSPLTMLFSSLVLGSHAGATPRNVMLDHAKVAPGFSRSRSETEKERWSAVRTVCSHARDDEENVALHRLLTIR